MSLAYNQYRCQDCGTVYTWQPSKRIQMPTHCRRCRPVERTAHHKPAAAALVLPGYQPWMDGSACLDNPEGPDLFFPSKGQSNRPAKAICRNCPVLAQCRTYALANRETHGVWGGLSEQDRRAIRRHRGEAA